LGLLLCPDPAVFRVPYIRTGKEKLIEWDRNGRKP